jgi:Putative lumazine-binding
MQEEEIRAVIKLYFKGTYEGDASMLKKAYHPDVQIFGSIQGKIVSWTLAEFIARVTERPTAAERQEKFDKQILFIDKTGDIAMVKAQVAIGELIFTDYITLLKIDGKWWIRAKSFTAS